MKNNIVGIGCDMQTELDDNPRKLAIESLTGSEKDRVDWMIKHMSENKAYKYKVVNKNEKEKVIGVDEITQSEILLKKGPYGFYLEKEVDGKKKRASLPAKVSPDNINLEFACSLLNLPKDLGKHPTIKEDILVKIGRYGPYLECNKKFYALKNIDKINLELLEAADLIDNYKPKQSKKRAKK